jgi:hypothetical protein
MKPCRLVPIAAIACSLALPGHAQVPPPGGGGGSTADVVADALFTDGNGSTVYAAVMSDNSLLVEATTASGDYTTEDGVVVDDTSNSYSGEVSGDPATELDFTGYAPDGTPVGAAFRPDGTSELSLNGATLTEFPQADVGVD